MTESTLLGDSPVGGAPPQKTPRQHTLPSYRVWVYQCTCTSAGTKVLSHSHELTWSLERGRNKQNLVPRDAYVFPLAPALALEWQWVVLRF